MRQTPKDSGTLSSLTLPFRSLCIWKAWKGKSVLDYEYDEDANLCSVIIPTVTSIRAAVKHYESMGGTASIFINDDGMQILDHATAE